MYAENLKDVVIYAPNGHTLTYDCFISTGILKRTPCNLSIDFKKNHINIYKDDKEVGSFITLLYDYKLGYHNENV